MRYGAMLDVSQDIDGVIAQVTAQRDAGFTTAWSPQIFGYDALTLLAVVGRAVPDIELGTAVVPTYPRHPLMLAAQALTTQAATGGGPIVPSITTAAEKAGRPAPRVVVGLPVAVTADADGAREQAARAFALYGTLPSYRAMLDREGAEGPADVAIVGDEEAVAKGIQTVVDAGATAFLPAPFGSRDHQQRPGALHADRARSAA